MMKGRSLRLIAVMLYLLLISNGRDYCSGAFSSAVPAIWNNLPTSVIEANSLPAFRLRLKTHLFTVAFENSG